LAAALAAASGVDVQGGLGTAVTGPGANSLHVDGQGHDSPWRSRCEELKPHTTRGSLPVRAIAASLQAQFGPEPAESSDEVIVLADRGLVWEVDLAAWRPTDPVCLDGVVQDGTENGEPSVHGPG
jgi:hypothetical protein